jgi:hypothetical protein
MPYTVGGHFMPTNERILGVRTLSGLPPWLLVAIGFVVFASVSVGCRLALRRAASPERITEVEGYAGKLLSVFGASFALLVGFSITISWSAVSAGQDAVDLQAGVAQQLSWSASAMKDQAGADVINANLRDFLNTVVSDDQRHLAEGNVSELPSDEIFDTLQSNVHRMAGQASADPVASGMVSAAASLTASWSKVTSVAQRRLPAVLVALILASGLCLAAAVGMSALTVERPFLMYLSALISAMSIAVVLIIDFPFIGIGVDLAPLSVSASSI